MSVVNIIHTPEAVHLFSDGGLFSSDGSVSAILSKAYCLPHLNAVISSRGSCYFANQLVLTINRTFSSFEALVADLPELFRAQYEKHEAVIAEAGAAFELWFIGWSHERGGPESYAISSHGLTARQHGVDAVPWEIVRLGSCSIVPCDVDFGRRLAARSTNTQEELGIAIAECQRQLRGKNPFGHEITGLAGFIQQSTVSQNGIFTKILKRFPDEIGKPVTPSPSNLS